MRRQFIHKGRRNLCTTIVANRWSPTSKTCSDCGAVKAKLPLHVRVFTCDTCGLVLDRDENAARNLLALAANCTTGTGVAGDQDTPACRNPVKPIARPAVNAPAGAGGQVAQACRTSGRRKRETVVRTPKRDTHRGDTGTDLLGENARNSRNP
ncbi:zinc ribbon domain-containing protein [Streptomyces parvulus]|uniref:zinc ribbon domain-containing protein n=1 Tax=Streptomyces parvulus TaxID=146923 RepID=UPI0037247EE6